MLLAVIVEDKHVGTGLIALPFITPASSLTGKCSQMPSDLQTCQTLGPAKLKKETFAWKSKIGSLKPHVLTLHADRSICAKTSLYNESFH